MKHRTAKVFAATHSDGFPSQAVGSARDAAQLLRGSMLYAMRVDDLIKIGWTSMLLTDRRDRIKTECSASVVEILAFTPGTRADERDLHHSLANSVKRGREWYHPTPEVMAVVNEWRAQWGRAPIAA